ncbi:MAG TPA: BON domain-containing protein [Polyangiales bacterium]|nr:BON domain-containing protein [Polyangiales bacterium]
MRVTQLGLVALALVGCAHRAGTEPVPESQTQALSRDAHPAQEVSELERPAPPAAAQAQSPDESPAARVESAAPPPRPTVAGEAKLETTEHHRDAPLTPPEPAASDVIAAPAAGEPAQPPAKLGAEIARADAELRERVQRALLNARSLSYSAKHVQVDVAKREVTLRGEVRSAHERKELEQIVRSLAGVQQLNNQVALKETATP